MYRIEFFEDSERNIKNNNDMVLNEKTPLLTCKLLTKFLLNNVNNYSYATISESTGNGWHEIYHAEINESIKEIAAEESAIEIVFNLGLMLKGDETALVGRDNGKTIYNSLKFKLENNDLTFGELENNYGKIIIIIPEHIITINKSFFHGMFAPIILRLGKKVFSDKYKFVASYFVCEKIQSLISQF